MKKFTSYFFALTIAVMFYGCFETTEEITINENGGGIYDVNYNMNGFFDMMPEVPNEDSSTSKLPLGMPSNFDTTIFLGPFFDTASHLTNEEKALMKNATVHVTINEKEKVLKMGMHYPYSKLSDIERINQISQANGDLFNKALKGLNNGDEAHIEDPENFQMPDVNSFFTLTYKTGLLERKVDEGKLKALQNEKGFVEMKQALSMFSSSIVKTVFHLPKPVKKVSGEKVTLSADKKTVTISSTVDEVFENANLLSYRIEY